MADLGPTGNSRWIVVAIPGLLVGAVLTVVAVAVGTLVFGTYGYSLFMFMPFVIGVVTGYLANRDGDIGGSLTMFSVAIAIALGSVALVVFALEGAVCIVMAAPLGLV